jgi:hypothetical protein
MTSLPKVHRALSDVFPRTGRDSAQTVPHSVRLRSSRSSSRLSDTWKRIDWLYVWSALIGLLTALAVIGTGLLMQTSTEQHEGRAGSHGWRAFEERLAGATLDRAETEGRSDGIEFLG